MKFIYFLLVIAIAGIACFLFRMFSRGELVDKPVYAALQAAELEHQGKEEAMIVYEGKDGIALAGFATSSKGRVWIALDSMKGDGNLFAIPDQGEKLIPCHLVNQLSNSDGLSPGVANILRSSCVNID